ncbi:MAG: ammonium transporter, partial [Vicinamibacterales bacterium]
MSGAARTRPGILVLLCVALLGLGMPSASEGQTAPRALAGASPPPAEQGPTPDAPAVAAGASASNTIAINVTWTLMAGFLVMFMQAGFAMLETGFTRAKNVAHTMAMNLSVYAVGMLGYWTCGYALQMGGVGPPAALGGVGGAGRELTIELFGRPFGFAGAQGFFLGSASADASVLAMFLFQVMFMDTAATIPTGSMAERWKFSAFLVFGLFMSMFAYPIHANWVWGGGWLSQLGTHFGWGHGYVDFAGSSVVHMIGGIAALAGAMVLGPRIGKFSAAGRPQPIPGHHLPMALVGSFVLAFGWFGFNAGSTLAGSDPRIAAIAVNTMLAGAAGALTAMAYVWWRFGKPDPTMVANGLLAGLVAITASCAYVGTATAVFVGSVAGVLVVAAVLFIEETLKIDDPVGAVSVHAVNGTWGVLALGLFADGTYGTGLNGVGGAVR